MGKHRPFRRSAGRALGQECSRVRPQSPVCLSPQSFNTYFSREHSRLLLLWRQVMGLRRLVSEVKMGTER